MKRAIGAVLVTLLAATALVTVALPAGAATARCDEGHWPATVQGRPASFTRGGRAGYYVWHDSKGWHLRTTTPRHSPHSFTGTITSSDDIRAVHVYRDEGADKVAVSGDTMRFSFRTWDHVDGVDFVVGCTESVTFALKGGGSRWPASRIWLGRTGTAPSNPFTISRVA